jgi:hypothetical protein
MSDVFRKLDQLKREHGFTLVRATRHEVWKSREGVIWICASTPSDYRVAGNQLTSLKRAIREANTVEILAISQFERKQADELIRGREKATAGRPGAAGTKKSRGTGLMYVDSSETRRLQKLSDAERAEFSRKKRETAERAKAVATAKKAEKAAEHAIVKSFLAWVVPQIETELKLSNEIIDGALAYHTAAVHAVPRMWSGKKVRIVQKPADEFGDSADLVIEMTNMMAKEVSTFTQEVRESAQSYPSEKAWTRMVKRANPDEKDIPYHEACVLSVPSLIANYKEWKVEALLRKWFVKKLELVRKLRTQDLESLQDYVRVNAMDLITSPQGSVRQNLSVIEEKLTVHKDETLDLLADWIVQWQRDYESRLLAKPVPEMCQRIQDRLQVWTPAVELVELRRTAREARAKVAAMVGALDELDAVIRKI